MALLTASECQALGVGLDLESATLTALLDREEAEIIRRFGAHTAAITELVEPTRGAESLFLLRPASAITSITEYQFVGDTAPIVRAAADYVLFGGQGRLVRAAGSLAWGRLVSVVYTPVDDRDLRRSVLLELARIATEQTAGGGRVAGLSYSIDATGADGAQWHQARAALYARMGWLS